MSPASDLLAFRAEFMGAAPAEICEAMNRADLELAASGLAEYSRTWRAAYAKFGHALPDRNGDDSRVLPIPATYTVGMDGRIALAYVDVDYRTRLDPSEVVEALKRMTLRSVA
jgi:peroxiredoxin